MADNSNMNWNLIDYEKIISGNTYIWLVNRGLTTLVGLPNIISGTLGIDQNPDLKSLVGGPNEVTSSFTASHTGITSLVGGPTKVGGTYNATNGNLASLEGSPKYVPANFNVSDNRALQSLVGGPLEIGGSLTANRCGLTSLDGFPNKIGTSVTIVNNPLTSLKGINQLKEMNGRISITGCPITSHILGVFLIKGFIGFKTYLSDGILCTACDIVNQHISKGRSGLLACTQELIEAGLADFAQI
jgi:hypothetical protein